MNCAFARYWRHLAIAAWLSLLPFFAYNTFAETATIAVATNFRPTLATLAGNFEQQSGHHLRIVSSSTGVLFNQITHGAPFDVLLAADSLRPQRLEQLGSGVAGTRFTYALGRLALAIHHQPAVDGESVVIAALKSAKGKISIANPDLAPYGLAAKQVLMRLELWPEIQDKLVLGANIAQSFQFVTTGNAGAGFVSLAQTKANKSALKYLHIPSSWHEEIRQQAILLQSGRDNRAATDFLSFLKLAETKAIITGDGYNQP